MANEERWTVTRAMNNFEELLEHVITRRQPIFIDARRAKERSAYLNGGVGFNPGKAQALLAVRTLNASSDEILNQAAGIY